MKVLDPYRHCDVAIDECEQAPDVGGYTPVRPYASNQWFSVYMPTGKSSRREDVPVVHESLLRRDVEAQLLEACHETRATMPYKPFSPSGQVEARNWAIGAFGAIPVALAGAVACLEGFKTHEIDQSWQRIMEDTAFGTTEPLTEGVYDSNILKAIFICGAGGSGKGRVGDTMFSGLGLKFINADTHLERFMRAANEPLSKVGQRYDLFNKAKNLRDVELKQYATQRLGLVIDSTGWAYDRIAAPFKKLRALGYDCYMVVVDTSLETARARNVSRGKAGGREVPQSYVDDAWYGLQKNVTAYKNLFGKRRFFTVDNDADYTDGAWEVLVAPKVQKIARKILALPLTNPQGVKWLKTAQDTLNAPSKEWTDDAKPKAGFAGRFAQDKASSKPAFKPVPTSASSTAPKMPSMALGLPAAKITRAGKGWVEYPKESVDENLTLCDLFGGEPK